MGSVIALANQKGGVGKTTTAVNLSAYLGQHRKKTLLVDIDPQGNATSGLGIDRNALKHCVYDCLINEVPAKALIIKTPFTRLDILPSSRQLGGAEIELVEESNREKKLKEQVDRLREDYDYIIIDAPPTLGLLTLNGLNAADGLLVPLQCEYYALEGLGDITNTFQLVKRHMNPNLELEGILLTMYDGRTNLAQEVAEEVRAHFKDKVFQTVIPRTVRLSEAPSYGMPILEYDPKSKGAEVYDALAKEVIKRGKKRK